MDAGGSRFLAEGKGGLEPKRQGSSSGCIVCWCRERESVLERHQRGRERWGGAPTGTMRRFPPSALGGTGYSL